VGKGRNFSFLLLTKIVRFVLEVMLQVKGLCGGRTQFFFFLMAKSVRFILEVVLQVKVLCGGRTQFFFFIGKTCKVYLRRDVAGERTLWGKDSILFFLLAKRVRFTLEAMLQVKGLFGEGLNFSVFFIGKTCKVYLRSDVAGERTLWGKDAIFLFLLAKSVRFTLEVMLQVKGLCVGRTQFFSFFYWPKV